MELKGKVGDLKNMKWLYKYHCTNCSNIYRKDEPIYRCPNCHHVYKGVGMPNKCSECNYVYSPELVGEQDD